MVALLHQFKKEIGILLRSIKGLVVKQKSFIEEWAFQHGFDKNRNKYCLKKSYKNITQEDYCDVRDSKWDSYQDVVYSEAKAYFVQKKLNSILDIGCGSGFKLIKYFGQYNFSGTEVEPTLSSLKKKYPDHAWYLSDFKCPPKRSFDMVIAVDVIEHLFEPDNLLEYINNIDCQYILLSTPERDKLGYSIFRHNGPPRNPFHIREWNQWEFKAYISKFFQILESGVVSGINHYVICRKRES